MLHSAQTRAGRIQVAETLRFPRWFAVGLLALGALLVGNTLLGPLVTGAITYPFSETVLNETLGLEAVSLIVVAPLSAVAGVLALRGRPLGAVLALGPTSYTAYMFVQYVAGPGYLTYASSLLLHVALFSLASALFIRAWTLASPAALPTMSQKADRRWAVVLLGMSAFVISRWIEALAKMADGAPLADAYLQDPGMYWSIFLLDLGIIVPSLVVSGLALWHGREWAHTALYALVGWFLLVPPSVTAMAITKIIKGDPHANPADTVVLGVTTLVFVAVAIVLYRPLLRPRDPST
jgi:hypothetical protein